MHEQEKMKEAEYFYSRMNEEINELDAFKYNLSAFLSAAGSVLQYALKEAEASPGGKAWYDGQINKSKIAQFFKERRNINIHVGPAPLSKSVTVERGDTVNISSSLHAIKVDAQGNITEQRQLSTTPQKTKKPEAKVLTKYIYSFPEWPGENDVLDLCRKYLTELQTIVQDGINKKFITP